MHVIELKKFREDDKIVTNEMKNLWLGFVDQKRDELVRMAYTDIETIIELTELTKEEILKLKD